MRRFSSHLRCPLAQKKSPRSVSGAGAESALLELRRPALENEANKYEPDNGERAGHRSCVVESAAHRRRQSYRSYATRQVVPPGLVRIYKPEMIFRSDSDGVSRYCK